MTFIKTNLFRLSVLTLIFTSTSLGLLPADDFDTLFDDTFFQSAEDPQTTSQIPNSEVPATDPAVDPQSMTPLPQAGQPVQSAPEPQPAPTVQPVPAEQLTSAQTETIPAEAVQPEPQQVNQPEKNLTETVLPSESEKSPVSEEKEIVLIRELLTLPAKAQEGLQGKPVSLANLLTGVRQPEERQQLTETYWELTEKLALYHLSLIYANDIEDCISRFAKGGNLSQSETAALLSARRLAEQRIKEAKISFTEVQFRFADLYTGSSEQGKVHLSIPTDIPTTVAYQTRYDKIKKEKQLTPETAFINEAIPARFEVIQEYDQAAADAFESYKTLYFAAGTSAEILLSAAERLTSAKESLVRSVTAYNCLIAAYVADTVGPEVSGTKLLTTMIRVPDSKSVSDNSLFDNHRATASQIPEVFPPKNPIPTSAEIPKTASAVPDPKKIVRQNNSAEFLR